MRSNVKTAAWWMDLVGQDRKTSSVRSRRLCREGIALGLACVAGCSSVTSRKEIEEPPHPLPTVSSKPLPQLRIGMSRDGILQALGKPVSTRTEKGKEVLVYLVPTDKRRCFDSREEYWVVIGRGAVEQFGTAASVARRPRVPFLLDLQQPAGCE
jgi:hypothetical protein